MISKIEPIEGTQDVYLDKPSGSLETVEHSTPEQLDSELDAVAGGQNAPGGRSGPATVASDFDELAESDEVKRAHDRKPDTKDVETALMLYETNCAARRGEHWQGEDRWAKQYEEERKGRIMHMYEFVRRLGAVGVELKLNDYGRLGRIGVNALACPGCKAGPLKECADDCKGRGFVYREHNVKHKRAMKKVAKGKNIILAVRGERTFKWMTLATLHNGASPEYSVMRFDRFGVPTNEKYHGWRTTLLDLMFAGVVTRAQAVKAFGQVLRVSEATEFYLQQVKQVKW